MGIVRRYRLFSLFLLILAMLGMFLAFFFVWVLAPLAIIVVAYFALVLTRPGNRLLARFSGVGRHERLQRLSVEAKARREQLARPAGKADTRGTV